jgi:glutathione S-transferase
MSDEITFFHSPQTRSTGTFTLLEELGAPYKMHLVNMKAGDNRKPEYLAINPMGKLPALHHRGGLITEQAACSIYLADLFPAAGLAPALDSPLRGPYLRWMVFYGSCFEPAVIDRATQRADAPLPMSPYGNFDTMLGTVTAQLRASPYLLGDKISAADILWGGAFGWTTSFKLVPELPEIMDYIGRITTRPAFLRVRERDAALAAEHATAAAA